MNRTEILNIVNEPSKHIQVVKIDGIDSIVYSSKFVELLELIPTMLAKDDMVAMLTELKTEIDKMSTIDICIYAIDNCVDRFKVENLIQDRIDKLKGDGK